MVPFRSIWVSDPLSGERISYVRSGMGPGRSVWVSCLGSVLTALRATDPKLLYTVLNLLSPCSFFGIFTL